MLEKHIDTRYMRYPGGLRKSVTFSYDDGCYSDIRLAKKLNEFGIKCTFNICSAYVKNSETDGKLTYDDINKYMLGLGHEVAVHGKFHRAPGILSPLEGVSDVLDCRRELEDKLDMIIRGMAYPNSGIRTILPVANYATIKSYLTELGIAYARTLGSDNNSYNLPTDWHAWMPTAHHDNPNLLNWIEDFVNMDFDKLYHANRHSRLMYIWGHTFEFNNKDNWQRMDEICEKLGNRDDIWYATNIEIYDYVKAYDSLVWRSDYKQVHNPTNTTVWFEINGNMYSVKSGETIKIDKY